MRILPTPRGAFVAFAFALFVPPAYAEVRPVVAIFDIEPSNINLGSKEKEQLSNYLADKIAETGFFRVVPRSQLKERLAAEKAGSYRPCFDDACQIELGKELAAQKIISARVSRIGDQCKVSATVYDLLRAATDISAVAGGGCDVATLTQAIDRVAADLSTRRTAVLTPEERRRYLAEARSSIPEPGRERVSPYFFVLSSSPERDRLPLSKTSAAIDVAGAIAEVNITQHYKNEGPAPLEAIYVFPASQRAAISSMRMMIGERVIDAKISESQRARATYEVAREEGKTAALLEQVRPNVYQINVAQILPGDEIKVELRYTELLVPERGIYELVYPTLAAPRYATAANFTDSAQTFAKNPYLEVRQAEAPLELEVNIRAGMPIARVESPSHRVDIRYRGPHEVHASLEKQKSTADFVLRWSLAGEQISAGLLLYPGVKENFFLMMMEPPQRSGIGDIVPREYIFVVDISGSMLGFPLEVSKKLMRDMLGRLGPTEYFNVILFAGGSDIFASESRPATRENIDEGILFVDNSRGGGGTHLLPALEKATKLSRPEKISRTIVVVTDGIIEATDQVLELVRSSLGGANLFAFGIGGRVNRTVIDGLARAGMGEPFVVARPDEAQTTSERFRSYVSSPVLAGIKYQFADFEAYDVEPPVLGDLFADRPLVLFGKYRGQPKGSIAIAGSTARAKFARDVRAGDALSTNDNDALRDLWARHRIQRLTDLQHLARGGDYRAQIEKLGIEYGIATEFTSFVAVDSEARGEQDPLAALQQPDQRPSAEYVTGSRNKSMFDSPPPPSAGKVETLSAGGGRSGGAQLERKMLEDPDYARVGFQLALDPVTAQASSDGHAVLSFCTIDALAHYGTPESVRVYGGLGFGYLAPRARLGLDMFAAHWLFLRVGTRAAIARDVDDAFFFTLSGELGLALRLVFRRDSALSLLASYLVGPAFALKEDRSELLQGGSLSLSVEL